MKNEHLQSSFDKAKACSQVVSLNKSPLQFIWHFDKTNGEMVVRMMKHNVCAVAEIRTGPIISWKGDLDNGEYFFIMVIEGTICAALSEHEMMLPYELHVVAQLDETQKVLDIQDQTQRFYAAVAAKPIVNKMMLGLKFEDIMKIFMWEYVSNKVEIFETNNI